MRKIGIFAARALRVVIMTAVSVCLGAVVMDGPELKPGSLAVSLLLVAVPAMGLITILTVMEWAEPPSRHWLPLIGLSPYVFLVVRSLMQDMPNLLSPYLAGVLEIGVVWAGLWFATSFLNPPRHTG